jgi:hypothetical protein
MSLTAFLALSILGIDFLIYVLFQWTYGEKRTAIARKIAAQRIAVDQHASKPFVVSSRKATPETQKRLQLVRERMTKGKRKEISSRGSYSERLA